MFVHSAEPWALLTGFGILMAMLLDYLFRVPFDPVATFSLTGFPAFALLSYADASRAKKMRDAEAERAKKRERLGKKKQTRPYRPIRNRWTVLLATSVLLLSVWIMVFFI
ncbi:hypothetical protein [Streptomyces sp. SP18CM02]|uniref:hypothetical protein n=1 Tax=Streptomyces sp. SP18CM02 TaxID=2758571 RepID=UPI00168A4423|nr:hypothetical protein [Streptomyces sp. SP18CM02]MBD3552599.1 hypothetical protein [Streptomyces sp. SP18CM02]